MSTISIAELAEKLVNLTREERHELWKHYEAATKAEWDREVASARRDAAGREITDDDIMNAIYELRYGKK